jgi:hypothetical protein
MEIGEFIPVVAIFATAWVIVTMAKIRHRRADPERAGGDIVEARNNARLADENERLRLTVGRLEERLAVLERIATDPAERTAREIEQLRQNI